MLILDENCNISARCTLFIEYVLNGADFVILIELSRVNHYWLQKFVQNLQLIDKVFFLTHSFNYLS